MTLDSILSGSGDSDGGALAKRTAAVSATGPRGQSAAVLIRLTLDTGVVLVSLRSAPFLELVSV